MSFQRFSLQPFPEAGLVSDLKIAGDISRVSSSFAIRYEILGYLAEFTIPVPTDVPVR